MNQKLRDLIRKRQRALAQCHHERFRSLRNEVNRERKVCRVRYYETKVEHLQKCKPSQWWSEVKKISRMTAAAPKNAGSASLFQHIVCRPNHPSSNLVDIANTINQAFLSPMSTFIPF